MVQALQDYSDGELREIARPGERIGWAMKHERGGSHPWRAREMWYTAKEL